MTESTTDEEYYPCVQNLFTSFDLDSGGELDVRETRNLLTKMFPDATRALVGKAMMEVNKYIGADETLDSASFILAYAEGLKVFKADPEYGKRVDAYAMGSKRASKRRLRKDEGSSPKLEGPENLDVLDTVIVAERVTLLKAVSGLFSRKKKSKKELEDEAFEDFMKEEEEDAAKSSGSKHRRRKKKESGEAGGSEEEEPKPMPKTTCTILEPSRPAPTVHMI